MTPLWAAIAVLSAVPDGGAAESVSMVQLIARPEEFDGRRVRLIAWLSLGFEESVVYLHREDFDVANSSNALWLELDGQPEGATRTIPSGRRGWVVVEGVFERSLRGHLGASRGGIRDVTTLVPWKPKR